MNNPNPRPNDDFEFSYDAWREGFVRFTLIGASVFGLLALIPAYTSTPDPVFRSIYIAAYLILLAALVLRVPYNLKAGVLLFLLYALGLSGLVETGIWGDSRAFLVSFAVMAALMFSARAGWIATGLSMVSIAMVGWFVVTGQYHLASSNVTQGTAADWISGGTAVLLLMVTIISGLRLLQEGFARARKSAAQTFAALRTEQANLEKRVEERTDALQKKAGELRAAADVARRAAEIRDLGHLLESAVRLISDRFGYYHAAIFLLSDNRAHAVLQAASSEGGKRMLQRGHRLEVGAQGIVGLVASERKPRVALDVGTDAAFFDNPDLPMTRSELALPLSIRNQTIGVLDIQSDQPRAFSEDDVDILQTLADQLALAIQNARLSDEAETALAQFENISVMRTREAWREAVKKKIPGYTYTPLGIQTAANGRKPSGEKPGVIRVPLELRGQQIGMVSLKRKGDDAFWTKEEQGIVEEISRQVALALDNARLLQDAQQRAQREQALTEIATRIGSATDLDSALRITVQELGKALRDSEVLIQIREDGLKQENEK
ncbi:MAG: GAF domain-containing protein [Chloroflexota bacterium]